MFISGKIKRTKSHTDSQSTKLPEAGKKKKKKKKKKIESISVYGKKLETQNAYG